MPVLVADACRIPPSRSTHRSPDGCRAARVLAVAFAFVALTAFSTARSALYGLYEHQEHLSSLTLTIVCAVYSAGVVASLLLAGHVSAWYGGVPCRSRPSSWRSSRQ